MSRTDWLHAVITHEIELRRQQIDCDATLLEVVLIIQLPHNGTNSGTIKFKTDHASTTAALESILTRARST